MKSSNWKADEMEMAINYRAIRLAYLFVTVALIVHNTVSLIVTGDLPTVSFLILCFSNIIFFSAKLVMTQRLTKDCGDEE